MAKSTMLKDLKVSIRDALIAKAFALDHADHAAQIAVDTLREIYGGDQPYIPKDDERLDKRDWDIWEEFNGTNHSQLAKKHGLTERQVYNRIAIIRPIAQARMQGNLFEDGDEAA
jgi:Mor family transcriptional regulator